MFAQCTHEFNKLDHFFMKDNVYNSDIMMMIIRLRGRINTWNQQSEYPVTIAFMSKDVYLMIHSTDLTKTTTDITVITDPDNFDSLHVHWSFYANYYAFLSKSWCLLVEMNLSWLAFFWSNHCTFVFQLCHCKQSIAGAIAGQALNKATLILNANQS